MIERKTMFSPCRVYRYTLWREWPGPSANFLYTEDPHLDYYPGKHGEYLMVIGLNPSTADETNNDPTIRRCVSFAKRWGFGALCMTNLFAFRATDPRAMMADKAPVGGENDHWISTCAKEAGMVLAAWGVKGEFMGRAKEVVKLINELHCLRLTKGGHPEHPLYMPSETQPLLLHSSRYPAVKQQ